LADLISPDFSSSLSLPTLWKCQAKFTRGYPETTQLNLSSPNFLTAILCRGRENEVAVSRVSLEYTVISRYSADYPNLKDSRSIEGSRAKILTTMESYIACRNLFIRLKPNLI